MENLSADTGSGTDKKGHVWAAITSDNKETTIKIIMLVIFAVQLIFFFTMTWYADRIKRSHKDLLAG